MRGDPRDLVIRDAHFPGRAAVDAYGNGGFRFADMSHRGSILCVPSGIYGWNVETVEEISVASLQRAVDEAAGIEVLLIGTGDDLVPLSADILATLREAALRVEFMATGSAVRTFNVLLGDARAVAGAFLAVD